MSDFPRCNQPFEARKGGHLWVRDATKFPHPEVRALASLEGSLITRTAGAK
jgi:hypothetical protein